MHGANRLGGNSLSDLLVFGNISGRAAANFALNSEEISFPKQQIFVQKFVMNKDPFQLLGLHLNQKIYVFKFRSETNIGSSCAMQILTTGSTHQGDLERFSPDSVGRQCVMNSISFLLQCNIRDPATFKTGDLDTILTEGDNLYQTIDKRDALLTFEDIPNMAKVSSKEFKLQHIHEGHVLIANKQGMHQLLTEIFSKNSDAVFILGNDRGGSAVAVRREPDLFFLFDAHSRSSINGLPTADGKCVLVLLPDLQDITNFLQQLGESLNFTQVSIGAFRIEALHHSSAALESNTNTCPSRRR